MIIEGYFRGIKNANETVSELKAAGITNCFSDINDHYMADFNARRSLPATDSRVSSLSGMILNSGASLNDSRLGPLAAANPMVSGMGGFEEIADVNCKVVVNANEEDLNKIKTIINKHEGELRNPNFIMPEGLENLSSDEIGETLGNRIE